MGSCASSLNCDGTNQVEIDPDIAGAGVLFSFYGSVIFLTITAFWAFTKGYLPPCLLNTADYHVRSLLTLRRRPFDDTFKPNDKPDEKVAAFIKAMGDQQLVTGLALVIAGLATRCNISCYEFSIVTYLAYSSSLAHIVYLDIARQELQKSRISRNIRAFIALCFIVLFSFAYVVNLVREFIRPLPEESVLQCIFETTVPGRPFDVWTFVSFSVIIELDATYLEVVCNLFLDPSTTASNELFLWIVTHTFRYRGFDYAERREILQKSIARYNSWLRPIQVKGERTRMSFWYILDVYSLSYCSAWGSLWGDIAYGTTAVILAIGVVDDSISGLKLREMSFGQIVALSLFFLIFLAVFDMPNRERGNGNEKETAIKETQYTSGEDDQWDGESISQPPQPLMPLAEISKYRKFLEFLIRFGVPKPVNELKAVRTETPTADEYYEPAMARKLAKFCLALWVFEVAVGVSTGVAYNFANTAFWGLSIFVSYFGFRILYGIKYLFNLQYFFQDEVYFRRNNSGSNSTRHLVVSNDRVSTSSRASELTSAASSVQYASSVDLTQRSPALDRYVFDTPARRDTEADIGMPMHRRATQPQCPE